MEKKVGNEIRLVSLITYCSEVGKGSQCDCF